MYGLFECLHGILWFEIQFGARSRSTPLAFVADERFILHLHTNTKLFACSVGISSLNYDGDDMRRKDTHLTYRHIVVSHFSVPQPKYHMIYLGICRINFPSAASLCELLRTRTNRRCIRRISYRFCTFLGERKEGTKSYGLCNNSTVASTQCVCVCVCRRRRCNTIQRI